jgi:hypothetical protein
MLNTSKKSTVPMPPKTKTNKRKRPKLGRPPLPKNQKRNKQIMLRFSSDELKEIEVAIHDQIVAEAAREMILESAKRRAKRQEAKKSA